MRRVALIAAVPGELAPIVRDWPARAADGVSLWESRSGGVEWIAACAGMGREAAGRALAAAAQRGRIHLVISIGWAGALDGSCAPGRAYRARGVIDAETGARYGGGEPAAGVWVVTSGQVAGSAEKRRLAERFGAALVDMEAAAVAAWAQSRGVPFAAVKGVSDGAGEALPDLAAFIDPHGRFQLRRFIRHAALRPRLWPVLLRLGRNSRRAARDFGRLLPEILDAQRTGA
jgi:adenosylhomocysteine nucleosidase